MLSHMVTTAQAPVRGNSLLAALLLLLSSSAYAAKSQYNLTQSFELPYVAVNQHDGHACNQPASCNSVNITVQPHSLHYFCGFDATYKIVYEWKAQRQLQTFLVRERRLKNCDIFHFDSCHFISSTQCRRTTKCEKGMHGLVFGGNICFAIVNNRDSSSWIKFKVESHFDKTLAGGKAGCLILTLIMSGLLLEPVVLFFWPHLRKVWQHFKVGRAAYA